VRECEQLNQWRVLGSIEVSLNDLHWSTADQPLCRDEAAQQDGARFGQ
jgi:hypothetical protein